MKPWSSEDFEILAEMPPTRGHDLKHFLEVEKGRRERMPPTRGHDLKLKGFKYLRVAKWMPPTRGHDLKQNKISQIAQYFRCPPHGGTT